MVNFLYRLYRGRYAPNGGLKLFGRSPIVCSNLIGYLDRIEEKASNLVEENAQDVLVKTVEFKAKTIKLNKDIEKKLMAIMARRFIK